MDLRIVNHASLGPESGNFQAIHRPEYQISGPFAVSRKRGSRRYGRGIHCGYGRKVAASRYSIAAK